MKLTSREVSQRFKFIIGPSEDYLVVRKVHPLEEPLDKSKDLLQIVGGQADPVHGVFLVIDGEDGGLVDDHVVLPPTDSRIERILIGEVSLDERVPEDGVLTDPGELLIDRTGLKDLREGHRTEDLTDDDFVWDGLHSFLEDYYSGEEFSSDQSEENAITYA